VKSIADKRGDAHYEIVDIANYKLPLLGEEDASQQAAAWNDKINSLMASSSLLKNTTIVSRHP
jgi:hypothetical protein